MCYSQEWPDNRRCMSAYVTQVSCSRSPVCDSFQRLAGEINSHKVGSKPLFILSNTADFWDPQSLGWMFPGQWNSLICSLYIIDLNFNFQPRAQASNQRQPLHPDLQPLLPDQSLLLWWRDQKQQPSGFNILMLSDITDFWLSFVVPKTQIKNET